MLIGCVPFVTVPLKTNRVLLSFDFCCRHGRVDLQGSRISAGSHGGRGLLRSRPLVPYREGPLSYEPAVVCMCNIKAPRWISWSDDNPGRRYYRCSRARTEGDCGFYVWFDLEHKTFMKNLLFDLRNAVWELRSKAEDITELKQINEMVSSENKDKVLVLKAQERDLEEKNKQLVLLANKISAGSRCSLFCCGFVMMLVGLFFGLMLGAM
ncbi:hypothetical protein PVAP13_5NG185900 [Panicum virgatum]|uniref:GRF-type domain-containing protein n=2 Tax=Panicum virgatum TaxID=38727 RepID=A0A8T0RRM6_PANVG|nr:hypothetical protein PVAP13_5NG185900 [Panicum virgatum]